MIEYDGNFKQDGSWSGDYYFAHQKMPKIQNGTLTKLGPGENGETLFSATIVDPTTNEEHTVYGAYHISMGEASIFEFEEIATSLKYGDKSITSIA